MTASGGAGGLGGSQAVNVASIEAKAATSDAKEIVANQEMSEMSMLVGSQDLTNPAAATRIRRKEEKFQTLESRRKSSSDKKSTKTEETAGDTADKFATANKELSPQDLRQIKEQLSDDATSDDVLELVNQKFSDPVLKSQALEYLAQTIPASRGSLKAAVLAAKEQFHSTNHQAVTGGKNILFASQQYAASLNTSPAGLRALYLNVTSEKRSCQELLTSLKQDYSLKEMTQVVDFLVKGMVADIKADGSSIDKSKLQVFLNETLNLQAIVKSYDFFEDSMASLSAMLKLENIPLPSSLTSESLGDSFHAVISDKFPTAGKCEKIAESLVGPSVEGKTEILNLFLKGLNQTSPRLFPSAQQRQTVANTLLNTLDKINEHNEDYPKASDFPKPTPWS